MDTKDIIISITAILTSLIAIAGIIFSYFNTNKILKANREQMKAENMIKLRQVWIQDFSKLASKMYVYLSEMVMSMETIVGLINMEISPDNNIQEYYDLNKKFVFVTDQLLLKVNLEGKSYDFLNDSILYLNANLSGLYTRHFDRFSNEELDRITELIVDTKVKLKEVIIIETNKLTA